MICVVATGAGGADVAHRLRPALERLNRLFAPAVAEQFAATGADRGDGALADPAQAPLCISVLRESLAPLELRVGVGIGSVEHARDAAERLGVTRQRVGDRLPAGHRRAVEEADAAIATYLGYFRRQSFTP